jgi:hypothetical protein
METDFITHRCPTCGGVSHPASGCVYSPTFIVCGPCTREFARWVEQMTNGKGRRGGRPSFYAHVNVVAPAIRVGG